MSFHEAFQMLLSIPANFKAVTNVINPPLKKLLKERDAKKKGKDRGNEEELQKEEIKKKCVGDQQKEKQFYRKYEQITHFVEEKGQIHNVLRWIHHFITCLW